MGQGEDVLHALAQRRDVDADDVQTVKEVGAEQAPLDLLLQIAVGGDDEAEVQLNLLGAGQPLNGLFLNELQELRLDMGRQLADLVQKQRTVVGKLNLADLTGGGSASESALLVAEQLRFDEVFVEDGAVDLDKWAVGPVAHGVDGLGDGTLAHAGLPGDEDVGLGVGGVLHEGPQPLHGGTFENEAGGGGPGTQLRNFLGVVLQGILQVAVVLLDGVDLLHGHGVEAYGVFQIPVVVEQGNAHGHDVFVDLIDGLGGGDLLLLPDDLRRDAGGEGAVHLQVKGTFAHDRAVAEAKIPLVILADPEDDALGVGEHHVVRQHQIVFGVDDVEQGLEVDVVFK